jgi:hypothetical protein
MSMRFRLLALALMLLPACASAPGPGPSAASVLAAAKAASGGAAWDRIDGLTERGSHGGMPYRTWLDFRRPGMRMESGAGEATRIHGFDGETDWTARGAGAAQVSRDPAFLRETVTTFYFSNSGYFFPDRFPAATRYLRQEAEGNRRFDAIEVAPEGGRPVELWFDRNTHLLARIVDRTGPPPVTITASDYRRVGGVLVAFGATVRTIDGTVVDEGRIDSIEFGPVAPRLFDPPPP